MLKILRNDDVAADTSLREIRTFCQICDKYGVTPIHAITPIGNVRSIQVSMDNQTIRRVSGTELFSENRPIVDYLAARPSDRFAVHGLWHTHRPTFYEIKAASALLDDLNLGFSPCFFVPPFNEWGEDDECPVELAVCGDGLPRIEDYLESGDPQAEMMYTHSWRFEHGPFNWKQFDSCLKRLTAR